MESDSARPPQPAASPETPIERDIRDAVEREKKFRRARGMEGGAGGSPPELVEITLKSFLQQPLPPSKAEGRREGGGLSGSQMQRDIRAESERERDLVRLGTVRGEYDRGERGQLEDKRRLFEKSLPGLLKAKARSQQQLYQGRADQRVFIVETEYLLPAVLGHPPLPQQSQPHPHSHGQGQQSPNAKSRAASAWGLGEFRGKQQLSAPLSPTPPLHRNPFFPLRRNSQSVLEREARLAQERERALRRQRYSVYGGQGDFTPSWADCPTGTEKPNLGKLQISWPPTKPDLERMNRNVHSHTPQQTHGPANSLLQSWEARILGNCQND